MKLLAFLLLAFSLSSLNSKLITQTGYWSQRFDASDITSFQVSTSPLAYKFAITYPVSYKGVPSVALSLNVFNLESSDPGVRVEAQDITKTGFNLYLEVQDKATITVAGVQWLATTDSRISVSYISKNSGNEGRLPTDANDETKKEFDVRVLHPKTLKNPKVAVYLSGFGFAGTGNANSLKFDLKNVDSKGVDVIFSTWGKSVLNSVAFYLLSYESDPTFFYDTTETPYGEDSKLFDNTEDHDVRYELSYLHGMGNDTEGGFLGIQQIEFAAGSNLRLESDFRRNGDVIEVKYLTRGETSINYVKSNIFVFPNLDSIIELSKTYTQTGLVGKNFAEDNHPFATDDTTDRFIIYRAQYPQRFRKAPSVMIGAVDFNLGENNPGFQIDIIATSPIDFTIKMTVKKGSKLKSFTAGWLATISPLLRITEFSKEFTAEDIAAVTDPETKIARFVFPYSHPIKFDNPGIGFGFNGFNFAGKQDIALQATYTELTKQGFNLVIETSTEDIQLQSLSLTVMHFEAGDKRSAVAVKLSDLLPGETQEAKAKVFNDSEFFVGVSQFDMQHEGGFEFKQDFFTKGSQFIAKVTPGKKSNINSITDTILVVPHNKIATRLFSQTGRFYKSFKDTDSDMSNKDSFDRTETYEIAFENNFDQVPEVGVSFSGFDIDGDRLGLNIDILSVSLGKFKIAFTAYAGTTVNAIEITWYATVSDEVTVGYKTFDAKTDEEFSNTFAKKTGNRYRDFVIDPHGVEFDNSGAQVYITGFKFGKGSSPQIYSWVRDANFAGANIVYGTYGDTQLEMLKLAVVQYEKNNENRGVMIESEFEGDLWKWSGQRLSTINAPNLGTGGIDWFGVNGFAFSKEHSCNFHEELNIKDDGTMDLHFKVWERSKIAKITTAVFHTVISE